MHRWVRTLCWTLVGASIGAGAQSMWLAVGLGATAIALGLVTLAGPVAHFLGAVSGWRRAMLLLGIGLVGGAILAGGAELALRSYEAERSAEAGRRREAADLRTKVAVVSSELVAARARNDVVERKRRLQIEKIRTVMRRISEAIEAGASLRYRLEHERRTNPDKFKDEFRSVHVSGIEKWRGDTATMLDEEFRDFGLGSSFSAIEGQRVGDPYAYELTRLLAAIDNLRGVHRDTYRYVEQMIP